MSQSETVCPLSGNLMAHKKLLFTMDSGSLKPANINSIRDLNKQNDHHYTSDHTDDCEFGSVQCVIRWSFGGNEVFIAGSFNSWKKQEEYKLFNSGHDHLISIELARGIHFYKFIVDGEWKYSIEYPYVLDGGGQINNYIDLTVYEAPPYSKKCDQIQHDQNFHQKPPIELPLNVPLLPILLGKSRCPLETSNGIHIPFHCISNHIYFDSFVQEIFGSRIVTFCVTKRWTKEKYIHSNQCTQKFTTIIYVSFRVFDEFHPITTCKKNYGNANRCSERFLGLENNEHYDSHTLDRLFTIAETFATIFK